MKVTWMPRIDRTSAVPGALPPVTTDFYELYWANLVVGTEWRHLTSWLFSLIPRWRQLGPRLRRLLHHNFLAPLIVLVIALAVLAVGLFVPGAPDVLKWIGTLAAPVATGWALLHLADVARYVNNVGDNVTIQRSIRREGLSLLRELHNMSYGPGGRPMYDRVIVVGHSLGSVVAYDIVRDYWREVYTSH